MSNKIFVKPMPGMLVRDPSTREHLPEGGAFVTPDSYWVRRKLDGDVIDAKPPKPAADK